MFEVGPSSRWPRVLGRAAAIAALTWVGAVTCVQWTFVVLMLLDRAREVGTASEPREWFFPVFVALPFVFGSAFSLFLVVPAWICLWRRRLLTSALFVWVLGLGSVTGMALVDPLSFMLPDVVPIKFTDLVVLLGLGFVAVDPFRVWRLPVESVPGADGSEDPRSPESVALETRDGGPRSVTP